MTYVCSDLHGFYAEYLDAVSLLSSDDKLYIIGDMLDRGSDGIAIIQDAMTRDNVFCLKGNHELMLSEALQDICFASSNAEVQSIIAESVAIDKIGQDKTLLAYAKLSQKEKIRILNFIENLPLYEELEVNGKKYILVHGGLPDFSDMPLEYYTENDLLFGPHDYDINHYENTIVIIGHQPTRFVHGADPDKIFRQNDTINVDCGLGFGGQLGVLCLDTNEEIYS